VAQVLKINKGGVGGDLQGLGIREQGKPGALVVGHALIVRREIVIICKPPAIGGLAVQADARCSLALAF